MDKNIYFKNKFENSNNYIGIESNFEESLKDRRDYVKDWEKKRSKTNGEDFQRVFWRKQYEQYRKLARPELTSIESIRIIHLRCCG